MTGTGRSDGSLAASVGLTDADLVEMYRLVALARARRRADVDPQSGRAHPVRDHRPGP